jgi:phage baseplate assembly protein W
MSHIYSDVNMRYGIESNREQVFDAAAINQSIMMILGTMPGQRLFRPQFGCNLYAKLFEPLNDLTAGSIQTIIKATLDKWEPRIKVNAVNVYLVMERKSYYVELIYTILYSGQSETYEFTLAKQDG